MGRPWTGHGKPRRSASHVSVRYGANRRGCDRTRRIHSGPFKPPLGRSAPSGPAVPKCFAVPAAAGLSRPVAADRNAQQAGYGPAAGW